MSMMLTDDQLIPFICSLAMFLGRKPVTTNNAVDCNDVFQSTYYYQEVRYMNTLD